MKLKYLLVALAALLLSSVASAQQRAAAEMFTREVPTGVEVAVEIKIDSGWHLYGKELGPDDAIGLPTTLEIDAIGLEFGEPVFPKAHRTPMEYGANGKPTWAWTYNGTIRVFAFGTWEDGPEDDVDIYLTMNGQTCSDATGSCVLYGEELESSGPGDDAVFADFPADLIPEVVEDLGLDKGAESPVLTEPFDFEDFLNAGHASAELHHRIVGNTIEVVLSVDLDEGWHLYGETLGAPDAIGKPTTVEVTAEGVTWDAPVFPAPAKVDQEFGDNGVPTWAWLYQDDFSVFVRGTFDGAAPAAVMAVADGLTCSDDTGQCVEFHAELDSAGGGEAELFADFPPAGSSADPVETGSLGGADPPAKRTLWQFVLLCIGGGLFTLLMPCTYPMIPITISFFTKQAHKNGKPPIELSLAYGIGIILMFELIGFVVGPVIIEFAQHWLTNAIIGIVFIYFALVLLGVVTLEPPRFLMQAAGGASQKGGLLGVFLMGAALVVTSFTCTAPILGTILGAGGTSGGYLDLAVGMGAFGLTLALPFVVLSMVPGKLSELPSSGEWMNTLKVTLGFVELAAAFKFLSNWDMAKQAQLLPDEILLLVWIVILGVAALYLLGFVRLTSCSSDRISSVRALFGIAFLTLVGYFGMLMLGYPRGEIMTAFLPGYSYGPVIKAAGGGVVEEQGGHVVIVDDYEAARIRALDEGKLLLVDFTGFT
jgi:thiol:disulfide interchange protein DsbD